MSNSVANPRNKAEERVCNKLNVPDLLKVDCVTQAPNLQYIDSREVQPVVSTESFCRFVIPKVGIMNPTARVIVPVKFSLSTDRYFLPLELGISTLVSRVVLKCAGRTISDISSYNHYQSFINNIIKPEYKYLVGSVKHGIIGQWRNMPGQTAHSNGDYNRQNGINYESEFEADITTSDISLDGSLNLANNLEFQMDLSSLVPCLSGFALPMYAIEDQVELEIYWNTDHKKNYVFGRGSTAADATVKPDVAGVNLIADFVLFNNDIMDNLLKTRFSSFSLPFSYDYNLIQKTLTKDGNDIRTVMDLGGASRYVKGIILQFENSEETQANYQDSNLGYFRSMAQQSGNTQNINIKVNGANLFPVDLKNDAEIASHLNNWALASMYINRGEYNLKQVNYLNDFTVEGHDTSSNTKGNAGNKQYMYFDISRLVNNRGIELSFSRTGSTEEKNIILRCWVIVHKIVVCSGGRFQQTYSMLNNPK
jgi:hypothetical protein